MKGYRKNSDIPSQKVRTEWKNAILSSVLPKVGDQFQLERFTSHGKKIKETITIVAIVRKKVVFDTGFEYPLVHFSKIINK